MKEEEPESVEYGYVRVSGKSQNEERQLYAMEKAGIARERLYIDKQSGKDFNRPEYQRLLRKLREGDALFVQSIDRLGRNYEEILEHWGLLTRKKKVDIVVLDMPLLDTRRGKDLLGTFISDIVLQLLSFVAENERNNIHERQSQGIAAAKARGVKFGRPASPVPVNFDMVRHLWRQKKLTLAQAADACGMKKGTFYGKVRRAEESDNEKRSL